MGTVYIMSNPCYKHPKTNEPLYKIGFSSLTGEERIKSLDSKTAVPMPFVIRAAFECDDPQKIEKCLHRVFDRDRINSDREFFTTDPALVIDILTNIGNLKPSKESYIDKIEKDLGGIDSSNSTNKFLAVANKYESMVADELKTKSCDRYERYIRPFADDKKRYYINERANNFSFGFFYNMWKSDANSSIRDKVAEYLKMQDGLKIDGFSFEYKNRGTNSSPYLTAICPYSKDTDGLNAFIKFIEQTRSAIEAL